MFLKLPYHLICLPEAEAVACLYGPVAFFELFIFQYYIKKI
jgi:hypothetical protein